MKQTKVFKQKPQPRILMAGRCLKATKLSKNCESKSKKYRKKYKTLNNV